ncbi:MAG: hypothetical protein IJ600_08450, partial [Lachnospiraceae bacterium]|nr:hypothetical protein [Lachnospiraceae bacterium]
FFNMAVIMVISIFTCGLTFLIFELTPLGIVSLHILLLLLLSAIDLLAWKYGKKIILRNMENLY